MSLSLYIWLIVCHVTHLLPGTSHCKCHCHYVFRCHMSLAFCLVPVIVSVIVIYMYSDVMSLTFCLVPVIVCKCHCHYVFRCHMSLTFCLVPIIVIVTMYSDVICHSPSTSHRKCHCHYIFGYCLFSDTQKMYTNNKKIIIYNPGHILFVMYIYSI